MIALIDSGVGNIRSVANALEYIHTDFKITKNPQDIITAEKIIFPGVGAFCDGMKTIVQSGLSETLTEQVLKKRKLYLGICLGMQLLVDTGLEDGKHQGLGWIKGTVRKLKTDGKNFKLPHIGWNNVIPHKKSLLFSLLENDPTFYFVHSYVVEPQDKSVILATCNHDETFAASINYKNIFGVQFHPEKSQHNGLQLLKNFVTMKV